MNNAYLFDTNVVIDFLNNKLPVEAARIIEENTVNISVITRIELLAWPTATIEQFTITTSFIRCTHVIELNDSVIVPTIEIRKKFKLKLPDAIIAATAIANNFILYTANVRDFDKVEGLTIINPHESVME